MRPVIAITNDQTILRDKIREADPPLRLPIIVTKQQTETSKSVRALLTYTLIGHAGKTPVPVYVPFGSGWQLWSRRSLITLPFMLELDFDLFAGLLFPEVKWMKVLAICIRPATEGLIAVTVWSVGEPNAAQ